MKTFYIIDENGEFYSEDKKVRYKALRGKTTLGRKDKLPSKGDTTSRKLERAINLAFGLHSL